MKNKIEMRIDGAPNDIRIYHVLVNKDGTEQEIGFWKRLILGL